MGDGGNDELMLGSVCGGMAVGQKSICCWGLRTGDISGVPGPLLAGSVPCQLLALPRGSVCAGYVSQQGKSAAFPALQTTGRKTLLDTRIEPGRSPCRALALFAMLTSLVIFFAFPFPGITRA